MRTAGLIAVALILVIAGRGAAPLAQAPPKQYTKAEILVGARVYGAQCIHCHGREGDAIGGIDLRRVRLRRALSDQDIARVITAGIPDAGMPPLTLQPAETSGVVAFIRAGFDTSATVIVGDATRGRAIFEGKGECGMCHRVNGRGPRLAPDLSDIGLTRSPAALQRSLTDPTSAMLPINRPVRIVTRDGKTVTGRRLNEDTYTVQVIDSQERLLSIAKRDIHTFDIELRSPMPSYATRLTSDEIADLVTYLRTLREQ